MASLTGQPFPDDVTFGHIPYVADKSGLNQVCGMPVAYKASEGMVLSYLSLFGFLPPLADL